MELEKIFYVNAGAGGTFRQSSHPQYDTTATDMENMFDHLKKDKQKKIVVYFHGGLVGNKAGMDTASRITRYVKGKTAAHPVSFVWETGLVETLTQNLGTVNESSFFKKLLSKIIKIAGKKLGIDLEDSVGSAKGIGGMSDEEIQMELKKGSPFESYKTNTGKKSASIKIAEDETDSDAFIESSVQPEVEEELAEEIYADPELIRLSEAEKPASEARLMRDAAGTAVPSANPKGIITATRLIKAAVVVTIEVIKRHVKNRDHGFYPTIIEEILREFYIGDIGSWVWSRMQNKATDLWKKDAFTGNAEDWHTGSYFLKLLKEYQDEAGPLTIDLVGHSAGSIVICEMLRAVKKDHPTIRFRNIVFMAPAVRCDVFAECVLMNQDLYDDFRYFTMNDEFEKKDRLLSVVYPRSLLYFISGLLENKGKDYDALILGLQRHTIGKKPYDTEELQPIVDYLKNSKRAIYSRTDEPGEDGLRSYSIKHGDFDNDNEATLDSIMFYLNR